MLKSSNIAKGRVQAVKVKLLQDCRDQMPKDSRLMGLDLGRKTIGVAVSDAGQSIASPLKTISRTKFSKDIEALKPIIQEYEIKGYIIGLPLNMDGSEGKSCDAVRSFADEMKRHKDVFGVNPFIALWDETLSTQAVDDFLDNRVDIGRKAKRGAKDNGLKDALAAQIILQSALDGF